MGAQRSGQGIDKTLRLTLVLPALTIGGLWRHIQNLAHHPLPGIKTSVIVIFDHPNTPSASFPPGIVGTHLHLSPQVWRDRPTVSDLLATELVEQRPDLVQSSHLLSDIYAIPAASALHLPAFRTVHGIAQLAPDLRVTSDLHLDWTPWQIDEELRLEPLCCHTVAVSRDLADRLTRYGIPSTKIAVIHNGVDLARFHPASVHDRRVARERLRIPHATAVVGWIGRLENAKNPHAFAAIAAGLVSRHKDVQFLAVGDGALRDGFAETVHRTGLARSVRIISDVSDVLSIYKALDILIQTSWTEGCSNVVLEAMAHAIPVVATGVGGTPELVEEGVTGWTYSPEDVAEATTAVDRLLLDVPLRRHMGSAGRRRAEDFFDIVTRQASLSRLCFGLWSPP